MHVIIIRLSAYIVYTRHDLSITLKVRFNFGIIQLNFMHSKIRPFRNTCVLHVLLMFYVDKKIIVTM